jgi:alpha-glucosidase
VFYNNTYDCSFDVGRERSGYWGQHMYYCADGGEIDYFIINGPSMKRVVQRFTDLTGKTAMAPREALGYLGSTMFYA